MNFMTQRNHVFHFGGLISKHTTEEHVVRVWPYPLPPPVATADTSFTTETQICVLPCNAEASDDHIAIPYELRLSRTKYCLMSSEGTAQPNAIKCRPTVALNRPACLDVSHDISQNKSCIMNSKCLRTRLKCEILGFPGGSYKHYCDAVQFGTNIPPLLKNMLPQLTVLPDNTA